ncbi:MAG: TonB family protein [Bryobacteraceae bacterium]
MALTHTGVFATIASSNPRPALPVSLIPAAAGFGNRIAEQKERATQPAPVRSGGFGEARAASGLAPHGPAVSDGGFGAVSVAPDRPFQPPSRPAPGHFGDVTAAPAIPTANSAMHPPPSGAVEILEKPRPAYTAEARSLRIEGEVVLDVIFGASGEVVVLDVRKRLGHGLDENAIAAARTIRFHPAFRDGKPVDATGIVHIDFQLAY